MKQLKIFAFIIMLIGNSILYSQNSYNITLPLLKIKEANFDSVLNFALENFKKCESFSSSKVISVANIKKDSCNYIIRIEPVDNQCVILNEVIIKSFGKPFGYLICDGHLVIVIGEKIEALYEIEKIKKAFVVNKSIIRTMISDYTIWLYSYKNGELFFLKEENKCID